MRRWALLAVLFGVALRLIVAFQLMVPTHDGGISLLAASCNQADFAALGADAHSLIGRWVPTSEWETLYGVDQTGCFSEIAVGLVDHDIHPPLYFWLLHLFLLALGVTPAAGLILNTLCFVGTACAVWLLARRDAISERGSVAALWFLAASPAALGVTAIARQYEMFGTWAAWFGFVLIAATRSTAVKWGHVAGIAGVTLLGCLTHYQFAVVLAVGALFVLARRMSGELSSRSVVTIGSGVLAGVVVAAALLPTQWYTAFGRQQVQADLFSISQLPVRVGRVFTVLVNFVLPVQRETVPLMVLLAVVGGVSLVIVWRRSSAPFERLRALRCDSMFFLIGNGLLLVALYLAFISPSGAMYAPYMSIVIPFVAVVAGRWASSLEGRWPTAAVVVLLLSAVWWTAVESWKMQHDHQAANRVHQFDRVLIDNPHRGVWPRVQTLLGSNGSVRVESQKQLADCSNEDAEFLLLSNTTYETTEERREAFIAACRAAGWSVEPLDATCKVADGYVFSPP